VNQLALPGEFLAQVAPNHSGFHTLNHSVWLQQQPEFTYTYSMIHMIASALNMASLNGGAIPGDSLTAVQTFLYFVATPVGIFLLITVLVLAGTREKKRTEPGKKPSSVIDSID
jgi:hypothetical protein